MWTDFQWILFSKGKYMYLCWVRRMRSRLIFPQRLIKGPVPLPSGSLPCGFFLHQSFTLSLFQWLFKKNLELRSRKLLDAAAFAETTNEQIALGSPVAGSQVTTTNHDYNLTLTQNKFFILFFWWLTIHLASLYRPFNYALQFEVNLTLFVLCPRSL